VTQRVQVLFRYKMLLEEHFEELRDLVTLENGKDARDAGREVRRARTGNLWRGSGIASGRRP
jgi:malonate-semialdehyde dehydrogenase (acetylating)/methylmalonate-semialdehyde dehydrogenase